MPSLHRRFPAWLQPGDGGPLTPFTLSAHFTTARPLEVRLRVPLGLVTGEDAPRQWAAWPVDRDMLKASAWVVGSMWGSGDVQIGQAHHWLGYLRRGNGRVVVGTHVTHMRQLLGDVDRLCPPPATAGMVDAIVDGCIARLLGATS